MPPSDSAVFLRDINEGIGETGGGMIGVFLACCFFSSLPNLSAAAFIVCIPASCLLLSKPSSVSLLCLSAYFIVPSKYALSNSPFLLLFCNPFSTIYSAFFSLTSLLLSGPELYLKLL